MRVSNLWNWVSGMADTQITMAGLLVSPLVGGSLPDLRCNSERPSVGPWQYRVSVSYQSLDVPGVPGRAGFGCLPPGFTGFPYSPAQATPTPLACPTRLQC